MWQFKNDITVDSNNIISKTKIDYTKGKCDSLTLTSNYRSTALLIFLISHLLS